MVFEFEGRKRWRRRIWVAFLMDLRGWYWLCGVFVGRVDLRRNWRW